MAGTMVDIKAISCQIHEGSISFVDPVMFCFWIANFAIVAFQFLFSYKFPEKKNFLEYLYSSFNPHPVQVLLYAVIARSICFAGDLDDDDGDDDYMIDKD